ncbi:MAG: MGMT family protein [Calditrichaeota bacterium]|nr:MAG: MGMT family protein [Calditrichota bacterium]
MVQSFTIKVKDILRRIPPGKVTTYGLVAAAAGDYRGARQVARILHSSSEKDKLPWHRVVNREGKISICSPEWNQIQRNLLEKEGIIFSKNDKIDFQKFLWNPAAVLFDV